jgi:hypothetical protein
MNITSAGQRFELDTADRFLRCPIFGEALLYPWISREEWRAESPRPRMFATKRVRGLRYFDTWSEGEGTREVRVGRWHICWTSWASVKAIAATWEAKRAAFYAGEDAEAVEARSAVAE